MNSAKENTGPTVVFTDGAAKGNPGPGGWAAVVVAHSGQVWEFGGGSPHTTNNRMELTGPIEALAHLKETPGAVAVYTDSTYVIRGIREWIPNWRRRGWKTVEGKDVLNRELWEQLWALVQARTHTVEWHYVRGHTGIPGNERVDEIANAFALGRDARLYTGPIAAYAVDIRSIPSDTGLPQSSPGKSAKAFSYLSVVDGIPMRHATWPECERRVKGRSAARFKKAISAEDANRILQAWGISEKWSDL